jgi:S-adenosylmethionine:tRNA ribosyltransferase-isomerase
VAEEQRPGREWLVSDFDYDLPPDRIAQQPLADRSASRLMIVRPGATEFPETTIAGIGDWLCRGDLLVANDSRVIPARLFARRSGTGGRVELLLLRRRPDGSWSALARPARKLAPGALLDLPAAPGRAAPDAVLEVLETAGDGEVVVAFRRPAEPDLHAYGVPPLPPYITAPLTDPGRYQTVYADRDGSVAAPTAGLHFTQEIIDRLVAAGVGWVEVTLHVGLDTFRPVTVEKAADHRIHREWCQVSDEAAARIAETRKSGGRVLAVGTTAARTLETLGRSLDAGSPRGMVGDTDIFITPGYRWSLVDGLLTNFHLPRSTLLMMVGALAGVETIRRAYTAAIDRGYRFYSFGDAMLILPEANARG